MPKRTKAKVTPNGQGAVSTQVEPAPRNSMGQWLPGFSGRQGVDAARARKALNADTIREMHEAFREGGREAIWKVMKSQPAIFLKLLVLLVPRELEITQTTGVKGLSDQQVDDAIAAIEAMLAARAKARGDDAKVIEAAPESPKDA